MFLDILFVKDNPVGSIFVTCNILAFKKALPELAFSDTILGIVPSSAHVQIESVVTL